MVKLNETELKTALAKLNGWELDEDNKIKTALRFEDFKQAFSFMTQVALKAEEMAHHPEWMNVFNRIEIHLTTHDASGITSKDIELARYINELVGER